MRKWTYAPWWVDLSVRALYWIADAFTSASCLFSSKAGNLLDTHCRCPQCLEREKRQQLLDAITTGFTDGL